MKALLYLVTISLSRFFIPTWCSAFLQVVEMNEGMNGLMCWEEHDLGARFREHDSPA